MKVAINYKEECKEVLKKEKGLFQFLKNRNEFGIPTIEEEVFEIIGEESVVTIMNTYTNEPFYYPEEWEGIPKEETKKNVAEIKDRFLKLINFGEDITVLKIERELLKEYINWESFYIYFNIEENE